MAGKYLNKKVDNLDLIVFDLDSTLWQFHAYLTRSPFEKQSNGQIVDSRGKKLEYFPEAPDVLQKLFSLGYTLAVASRTTSPNEARQLLDLFGWTEYFKYFEIYPGCKVTHFNEFKKQSGVPLENMLFSDDEPRNIADINEIGSVAFLVKNGVNFGVIENGIEEFVGRRS